MTSELRLGAVTAADVHKWYRVYASPTERVKRVLGRPSRHLEFQALDGVSFAVEPGTALGIVGENGAGKSTLLGILGGLLAPEAGTMEVDGTPYAPRSPRDARDRGIALIHQELSLFPHLSVAENVLTEVGLYLAGAVAQVDEGALAHDAHGSYPAGNADLLAGGAVFLLLAGQEVGRLLGGVSALVAGGIGVAAAGAQALQLGLSLLDELFASVAQRLLGFYGK